MYTIYVDDNYHYQDESERYTLGTFKTYPDAIRAARKVVNKSLAASYKRGMTPAALLHAYKTFGKDPYIIPDEGDSRFSAWTYAEERCAVICKETALRRLWRRFLG
ncbi:MAG: hypothetical protein ACE5G0_11270 [Rhodothermales bacterium]